MTPLVRQFSAKTLEYVRQGSACDGPIGGKMHAVARLIHKLTLI